MYGLSRATVLSTIALFFVFVVGYTTPRKRYLPIVLFLERIFDTALYGFLYFLVGFLLWSVLVSHVILPLLNAVLEKEGDESGPDAEVSRQPHDEESLVPEGTSGADDQSNNGFRGYLSTAGDVLYLVAVAVISAALVRPKRSSILLGTWQVLARVLHHTGIITAIIFGVPLVVFAPLLIIWTIVKRLAIEPHKTSWSYALKIFARIYVGTFVYVLAIEGISLFQPREAVFGHLVWQAGLLSRLFSWTGFAAYPFGMLWLLTDKTASYFLRRGLSLVSATLKPRPPTPLFHSLFKFMRLLLLPIVMICNSYIYDASHLSEGLISALIIVAWLTVGVLAVFVFDVLIYWTYFFWSVRRRARSESHTPSETPPRERSSPTDVMAVALVGLAVRDPSGKTLWDTMRKTNQHLEEADPDISTASEKLVGGTKAEATSMEREKAEPVVGL
ncbi:hypothetical protein MVEN_01191900 [Mycena venus]|uniref:Uncharacterized protein n=1 Tax=Mycena venus TaxID=2733690 RepID=A0A8H6Y5N3_9AGAR|nr:hypothetical protein MVEN_01191900 [Mycena venus]